MNFLFVLVLIGKGMRKLIFSFVEAISCALHLFFCLNFPDLYYFLWRYFYIGEKIGEEEGSTCFFKCFY